MNEEFVAQLRNVLADQDRSMSWLSQALSYDKSYVSKVLNGTKPPSLKFARAVDGVLGTDLAALINKPLRSGTAAAVGYLLEHDNRHGGDHIASAAVQVWKHQHSKLMSPSAEQYSRVAELAEIAGWILFDANRQDEARQAFLEAQHLSKLAGDRSFEWFTLDLLAMHCIENGRLSEAVSISEELLSRRRIPPRVALLARVRMARAYSLGGERRRAVDEIQRARGALEDSMDPRDPEWTWWVDDEEMSGQEGEVFLALDEADASVSHFTRTNELVDEGGEWGRNAMFYRTAELTALADAGAWREAEHCLTKLAPLLDTVTSARTRARLARTVRTIERDAPRWLIDAARDTVTA